MNSKLLLALVIATTPWPLAASEPTKELGRPLMRSYGPQNYGAHPQNWAIVQDERGVLYFGNSNGVLEYDGSGWRIIPLNNDSFARSLAKAPDGTIFVGGVGDLGYLAPNERGELGFVSLVEMLPAAHRSFSDVWQTHATSEGVFFVTQQSKLMRWARGRFTVWDLESRPFLHLVNSRILLIQPKTGLMAVDGDELQAVPGGEVLAGKNAFAILPYSKDTLLVGTQEDGLYLMHLSDGHLEQFQTEVDDELRKFRIYHGIDLPNGDFVLATYSGGAFVVDRTGRLVHRLDKSTGVADNSVWHTMIDQEGSLWLALNRGLSRVDILSPITAFDEAAGLEGTVETIVRHEGLLYVGTSDGLFFLRDGRFHRTQGVGNLCWYLLSFEDPDTPMDDDLLVGTNNGIYEVDEGVGRLIARCLNAYQILQSRLDPNRFFVADHDGVFALRLENGRWRNEGRFAAVTQEVESMVMDATGALWLGTAMDGVIRLSSTSENEQTLDEVDRFGLEDGLPTLTNVRVVLIGDELLFATPEGLFAFDSDQHRFTPDHRLETGVEGRPLDYLRVVPENDGDVWLGLRGPMRVAMADLQEGGTYRLEEAPFLRLPSAGIYALLSENDGITWIGGVSGLFRYDEGIDSSFDHQVQVLIRRVKGADGAVLYGGADNEAKGTITHTPPLTYRQNSIQFEYSATSFIDEHSNTFSYRLEGFEEQWSEWSRTTSKEYTNLREGHYRFAVKARTPDGLEGSAASFAFRISPPWYRTLWAYGAFVAFALGLLYVVERERSSKHIREKAELEGMVRQRTSELVDYTLELETTQEDLRESRAELEAFSYSVSHDLQAPLRRIRGFSKMLLTGHKDELNAEGQRLLGRIVGNAEELSELVDALLTLSRLSRSKIVKEDLDISSLAHEIVDELRESDPDRLVDCAIESDIQANGDPTLVRVILTNLLGNAWKFTRNTAEARIEVGRAETDSNATEPSAIWIRDNGSGFDPRYADKLFAPFQRLHDTDEFEGSGIGLATVYRLIHRHGGRVWAQSEVGQGATFYFSLEPKTTPNHDGPSVSPQAS
ncbi:MAG: hypothetical protein GY906_38045 [bacterium]|nr:hypothetical protein [bacterium]